MNFKRITAALFSVVLLVTALTSCKTAPASTPEDAAEKFLMYFSQAKYNNAFNYVEDYDGFSFDDRNSSDTKKLAKAVSQSMTYTVVGKTENENPVEVVANVTCIDVAQIYKTCTQQVVSSMFKDVLGGQKLEADAFKAALNKAVLEAAAAEDAPTCTNEVTFKLTSVDGSWFIIMDDHTLDLVCGNIISANNWIESRISNGETAPSDEETEQDTESAAESAPAESAAETTSETAAN